MNRNFLLFGLCIGLVAGLSLTVGGAWFFKQRQMAERAAIEAVMAERAAMEMDTGGAAPHGGDEAAGGNNARTAKFAELDTDQDGGLTLSEFSVGRKPAEAAKWFAKRDTNHDGILSREEFLPWSAPPKTP